MAEQPVGVPDLHVVEAAWIIRPESPAIAPCESCRSKPRVGVGVLEVPPGSNNFVVICPYCMVRAMVDSLDEGVRLEVVGGTDV